MKLPVSFKVAVCLLATNSQSLQTSVLSDII
uniref:Uncharacterized protein n=1 Tax=Anguilla anguilla TaxID=7936 RepID=A0A0E9RDL2_ANGAN